MRPNPRDRTLEFSAGQLIRDRELVPAAGPILVAVSGGPDSIALWHFLAAHARSDGERGRRDAKRVVAAHVNHGLRGHESDGDARFVQTLAERWELPLVESRLGPLPSASEEVTRLARYAALRELAGQVGADRVFTAHTADDQAETVILRLVRGAGLRGLAGMPVRGRVKGVSVARPLLGTTREEVLDYARRHDLSYRVDSTNLSPGPLRNFVRLEVLPRIRDRMNASAREAILRAAGTLREAEEYLSAESRRLLPSVLRRDGAGKITLDAAAMLGYPKLLRSYLFRDAVQELNGDIRNLTATHIDALLSLLSPPSRRSVDLPGRIRASREREGVRMEVRELRISEPAGPRRHRKLKSFAGPADEC